MRTAVLARDNGEIIIPHLWVADTPFTRFRGLLGKKELPKDWGMLITPCSSIHMFFMRFMIDAVFVDREMRIVACRPGLRPWRIAWARNAYAVLELPAGTAAAAALVPGELLHLAE